MFLLYLIFPFILLIYSISKKFILYSEREIGEYFFISLTSLQVLLTDSIILSCLVLFIILITYYRSLKLLKQLRKNFKWGRKYF